MGASHAALYVAFVCPHKLSEFTQLLGDANRGSHELAPLLANTPEGQIRRRDLAGPGGDLHPDGVGQQHHRMGGHTNEDAPHYARDYFSVEESPQSSTYRELL